MSRDQVEAASSSSSSSSSDDESCLASEQQQHETKAQKGNLLSAAHNNDDKEMGNSGSDEGKDLDGSDNDDGPKEDPEALEDLEEEGSPVSTAATTLLSKSWSIEKSHVPTFTGGKVTACRDHKWLLLPVHGDLAVVDATVGIRVSTLRGQNDVTKHDDEDADDDDEGLDRDAITAYTIDSTDQIIITCTRNMLLQQYSLDAETGKTQFVKTWCRSGHILPVTCMTFHMSNIFLATGSVDGTVRIWDSRGSFVTHVFRPIKGGDGGGSGRLSVTAITWREEVGQLVLAIARDDGSVTIHDLRDTNNNSVVIMRDHVSAVTAMEWWGEEFFLSAGRDAILNLWRIVRAVESDNDKRKQNKKSKNKPGSEKLLEVQKLEYRRIQSIPSYEQLEGMVVIPSYKNPNELRVATAGSKGMVRLWKATVVHGHTPELKLSLEQPSSQIFGDARGGYMGLVLNRNSTTDSCKTERLIAVDAEHNLSFLSSKLSLSRTIVGNNDEILDLKIIPGGSNSMVVATNSPQIRIFDLGNFSCHVLDGHTATVLCVEVSPCGRYVASCGKDKTMRLWRVGDRKCVGIATGHTEPIGACGLSRKVGRYEVQSKAAKNGGGAFCVTASMDRTLKRWNLPGQDEMTDCTEDPIKLEAATSIRGHEKDINIIAVAPNDSFVVSGSQDKTVKVWNITDLSLRATLKGHRRGVWDCQFSPIDRVLATSSGDKTIKLWSLSDFSCVRTFQGHLASVLRVRFLKTGLQLMSAGADGLIKLWTIRTNECETTLDGHSNKVWALDIKADGKTIVSGGADAKLAIWEDNTKEVDDEKRALEAESILLDQKLANHLRYKEYGKALEISIQANKPLQALKVLHSIIENDIQKGNGNGLLSLQHHVKAWDMNRVAQVLKFCREWNTRARNAQVAMLLVQAIFTTITVEKLCATPGIPEILAGIEPYAERHFERLDRLHTSTYLLDFTLSNMGELDPSEDVASEKQFDEWAASSKLVLPPKQIDGRIQVGGRALIGATDPSKNSDSEGEDDDEVRTIGDSSSDGYSEDEDGGQPIIHKVADVDMPEELPDAGDGHSDSESS